MTILGRARRRPLMVGVALVALSPLAARAQTPLDNYRLPSGQFLTPTAAPGSSFVQLSPGLANYAGLPAGGGKEL